MALRVETGIGVRDANAYITARFGNAYLTDRGRIGNLTDAKIIAATDYIEKRFGSRFYGEKKFEFTAISAQGVVEFAATPVDGTVVIIGETTYTFKDTPSDDNDVQTNADLAMAIANLQAKIETSENRYISSATVPTGVPARVVLVAAVPGRAGNYTTLQVGVGQAPTPLHFTGGADAGPQRLSFPRKNAVDRDGNTINGVPLLLMEACAEYADRAQPGTEDLLPDSTASTAGVIQRKEQVGPIVEEIRYAAPVAESAIIAEAYPAADNLLKPLLRRGGGTRVIRN